MNDYVCTLSHLMVITIEHLLFCSLKKLLPHSFYMHMCKRCAFYHVLLSFVSQSATGQARACVGCLARFCLY